MNRRIVLSPDAWADLDSAARWYTRIEKDLSRRFRAEIDRALLRIATHAYASLRVRNLARRVLTNRFRYRIDFIFEANTIIVLAITHQRRQDTVWKDRIDEFKRRHND